MLMSVRTALAKLAAAAAGGALVGGAVHVAEPQATQVDYKSGKTVKAAAPVKYAKAPPPAPPRQRVVRRVVEEECCEEEEYAMVPVPMPLPPLPQGPVIAGG